MAWPCTCACRLAKTAPQSHHSVYWRCDTGMPADTATVTSSPLANRGGHFDAPPGEGSRMLNSIRKHAALAAAATAMIALFPFGPGTSAADAAASPAASQAL